MTRLRDVHADDRRTGASATDGGALLDVVAGNELRQEEVNIFYDATRSSPSTADTATYGARPMTRFLPTGGTGECGSGEARRNVGIGGVTFRPPSPKTRVRAT